MELKHLEIFVCVAKTLSFSKAAEKLYVSQPTVSAGISALEKELRAQLLLRTTKEVSLTKAGSALLPYAQQMLSLKAHAQCSIGGMDKQMGGTIDIIASTIPAQHLLPEILAAFQRDWPNVQFHVKRADSREVERAMRSNTYDFGMVGAMPGGRFICHPVYDDELVLAVPIGFQADEDAVRGDLAAHLLAHPFVMREAGSGTRTEIEGILAKLGMEMRQLRASAYFPDAHSILLAVSRGMGISLVPRVAASMYEKAGLLRVIGMNSPAFRRKIYLIHNREMQLGPLQQAFSDHALSFYC